MSMAERVHKMGWDNVPVLQEYHLRRMGYSWLVDVIDKEIERESVREAMEDYARNEAWERFTLQILGSEGFYDARKKAARMGEKIKRALPGRLDLAEKVGDCFSSGKMAIYAKGIRMHPFHSCGYGKLCPIHARSESRRRLAKYFPPIQFTARNHRLQHLVLTMKNLPQGQLEEMKKQMWSAWNKLRRRAVFANVVAAMANMETTWNLQARTWHLHLHILLAVAWNRDYSWKGTNDAWNDVTDGKGVITHHSPVKAKNGRGIEALGQAIKEIIKYTCKFGGKADEAAAGEKRSAGLLDMPDEAFAEWFSAFWSERTLRTYGYWFKIPDPPDQAAEVLGELLCEVVWYPDPQGARGDLCVLSKQVYISTVPEAFFTQKMLRKPKIGFGTLPG